MKNNWKRMAAFLLTVCLLFALLPSTVVDAVSYDVPAGSTVYDLDLYSTYKSKPLISDNLAQISSYNNVTKNWCWKEDTIASPSSAFKSSGMTLYSVETEWVALKIMSPGEGLHTVGLNYSRSINSGVCAVYVLPADTEDIAAAMEHSNRVGQVTLTNLENSDNAAKQALVGTWEFGSDEEYILVLEANRHTVYNDSRCYLMLRQIFMTPGDIMEQAQQQAIPSSVTVDPGPIKIADPVDFYSTTTQVNGSDYMFMPIKGGKMLVFDLDKSILVNEVEIPFSIARGITVDADGVVWCVGEGRCLFRYDPKTRIGEKVLDLSDVALDAEDATYLHYADGYLYFGIFPSGVICKYNIKEGTYEAFGPFHEDCNTASAIIPQGDYIYAGITGDKNGDKSFTSQVIKVDITSGDVKTLDLSSKLNASHRQFNGVALAGNLLLMGSNVDQSFVIAVDVRTMDFVDLGRGHGITFDITEEVQIGDKTYIYFYINGNIYSMDVKSVTDATTDTGITGTNIDIKLAREEFKSWEESKPLRCGKHSIVEVDDPAMPGKNIVTYYTSDGPVPRLLNLQTGAVKKLTGLVESGYGSAMPARPLVNGLSGSKELYIGAFNTPICAIYNTETGKTTNFISNSAQTDAFVFYDGVLYTGNYNNASITKIDLANGNKELLSMKDSHNQARIHTLTAGGDKVFAGTTPYTGFGGCLAWVDVNDSTKYDVIPNIVENQSINCLVYQDGLVFGTTYIDGGSGSGAAEGASAKLFVFDVDANSKVAEFDLRQDPYKTALGIDSSLTIDYIAGIAADPKETGKFWGIVSQTLFSFTYDKDTQALSVTKELSFGENTYSTSGGKGSFPRPFCFDGAGNLYVAFDDAGGMRRIDTENPADNERLPLPVLSYYALGEDGNLYYTWGDQLCMFPLNVTEDDWRAAEAVDEMILAIGNTVTEAEEEAILAARAAYDSLSLKEKALVQYLYMLGEQEAELLELEIAALPEDISLDNKEQLDTLWETYCAMTERQKNCIKNYDKLVAAVNAVYAYEGVAAYQAAGKAYYSFENAVAAAVAAGDKTVTLVENVTAEEILLTDGVTLDLYGHTLTVEAFRAYAAAVADGFVVDSSEGNEGVLKVENGEELFRADNPDLPLYDETQKGYRFFDYKLELHPSAEEVGTGMQKFWFKFHLYTNDEYTELDQNAYDLVTAGGSDLEISTKLNWKGKDLQQVYFGIGDSVDAFSQKWATGATAGRWLYVIVHGLDDVSAGKLTVEPVLTANGVKVTAGAITYEKKMSSTGGWSDEGPSA